MSMNALTLNRITDPWTSGSIRVYQHCGYGLGVELGFFE